MQFRFNVPKHMWEVRESADLPWQWLNRGQALNYIEQGFEFTTYYT